MLRADSSPGVGYRHHDAAGFVELGFDGEDPRLVFRRHRVDVVHDQVEKHLLELDSCSLEFRQLPVRLDLEKYPVLLQVAVSEGKGFVDELVQVERSPFPGVGLEVGANVRNHGSRAMPIRDDVAECFLGFVEIRGRAVKEAQARIGSRHHRSQRLPYLVSNRSRDGVPGHQSRLALATLREDRAERLGIKHLYLVQQANQDENAGYESEDANGIPADAEADRSGVVAQRYLDRE